LKGEARARLRYLLALLAKDLSQNAHRVPGAVEASEDVAAILALAERNLRGVRRQLSGPELVEVEVGNDQQAEEDQRVDDEENADPASPAGKMERCWPRSR